MRNWWFSLIFFTFSVSAQYTYPFQNPDLSVDDRLEDLLSRLTLEEKLSQLFIDAPAIDRLNISAYYWWNEALHGVARAGKATVFPQAIGLAATFDENLMLRVSSAIADEARAKHNYFVSQGNRSIYTGLTFWSPNINIFRDPRWGRGQETYGEDPFLTGRMAVNFVRGLQGQDPKYLKTVATVKHYAVHSGPEESRHRDNFFVNNRDLYQTYLPAFKMAVKEAQVQSVMCAYNRFRDQPCCGSNLLLTQILRDKYGFDGYVVSDCGALTDIFYQGAHELVPTSTRAWGKAIHGGTDLNCENYRDFLNVNLDSAVETGILNLADINQAVKRLFAARLKLGLLDPPNKVPFSQFPMSLVGSYKHQELALEAAQKSLVLLKNDGILPLKSSAKVALIGPNAAEPLARLDPQQAELYDADALIDLAERTLVAPLDAQARAEIEASARQVAMITALVALALADVATAAFANLRMIRRIAEIYGGRSGGFASWGLLRRVFAYLVATGAVALTDDLIGTVAGGGVLPKLSRRFGEGVVNGALTARIGLAAMELCRPLPFVAEPRPSVSALVGRALIR